MLGWCGLTLYLDPAKAQLPTAAVDLDKKYDMDWVSGAPDPDRPKLNKLTGRQEDPIAGALQHVADQSAHVAVGNDDEDGRVPRGHGLQRAGASSPGDRPKRVLGLGVPVTSDS